jgi:hypothetical protein
VSWRLKVLPYSDSESSQGEENPVQEDTDVLNLGAAVDIGILDEQNAPQSGPQFAQL